MMGWGSFFSLCKLKFPTIGKNTEKVSNDWKILNIFFQWLEKTAKNFPMVGKMPLANFQWLENSKFHTRLVRQAAFVSANSNCLPDAACSLSRLYPRG
ncbi:MAG: hypothetical protein EOM20_07840 [Spartobacteria bacterium]|nr:hypothetical protein [Spartobacteria bacterium]